jgi:hypothetical protein
MHKWAMIAALLLISACSDTGEQSDTAGKAADTPAQVGKMSEAIVITPGLWETKIQFKDIQGKGMSDSIKTQMMKATGGTITVKSCITKEQADKPNSDFFGAAEGSNCTFEKRDISGTTMDVAMTCKPDGKTVIKNTMSGTYSSESYMMDMQQQTSGTPIGDLNMTGTISAKRLGACPA